MGSRYRSQKGPYHYDYLRKDDNDTKRHKSRCIYYEKDDEHCVFYCLRCKDLDFFTNIC